MSDHVRVTQVPVKVLHTGDPGAVEVTQVTAKAIHTFEAPDFFLTGLVVKELHTATPWMKMSGFCVKVLIRLGEGGTPGGQQREPRERPEFGHARRIRDVHRGAGHRWIDNPGRRG